MRKHMIKLAVLVITVIIVTAALAFPAMAADDIAYGAATVDATSLNIRENPGTEYNIVGKVGGNSIVVILERTNSDWYRINYEGTVGYVSTDYLTDILIAENFTATGTVTKTDVRMRKTYSTDSAVLGTYQAGTEMTVIGINTGWYKVKYDGHTGYIRSDLMEITDGPSVTVKTASGTASELGTNAANLALQYVGYRYVYGAESPSQGFDCSGLVYYVYGQHGHKLARTASQQYRTVGTHVAKSDLQAGDLVFFSSNGYSVTHVGIYIGDNRFVHASTSTTGVIISDLSSAYYTRVWYGAKRVA